MCFLEDDEKLVLLVNASNTKLIMIWDSERCTQNQFWWLFYVSLIKIWTKRLGLI